MSRMMLSVKGKEHETWVIKVLKHVTFFWKKVWPIFILIYIALFGCHQFNILTLTLEHLNILLREVQHMSREVHKAQVHSLMRLRNRAPPAPQKCPPCPLPVTSTPKQSLSWLCFWILYNWNHTAGPSFAQNYVSAFHAYGCM